MTDHPPANVVPLRRRDTSPARAVADLGDTVIDTLFAVGLHLNDVTPTADTTQDQHLRAALDQLDELIRVLRNAAFTTSTENASHDRPYPRTRFQPSTITPPVMPAGHFRADIHELLDQSEFLRERLHRVTVALAITEERIGDAFERLAATDGPRHEDHMLTAKRARASASHCRDVMAQLDALRPY